jgi:hypothetical protein
MMVNRKPRILLAARKIARQPFITALEDDASIVGVETLDDAVTTLKRDPDIDVVCCTIYFDESRMFDLLRWVRVNCEGTPVVCARALPKDLPNISLEAVSIATRSLGAAFIDFPALVRQSGTEAACLALRSTVLGQVK